MAQNPRILNKLLQGKVMSAEEAARLIPSGATVGMSGFTGAGYPKAVPTALAKHAIEERLKGKEFKIGVLTGASTGPELDQVMGAAEAISFRFPYQGDAAMRQKINAGLIEYQDMHLSHAGTHVRNGFYGPVNFALIEITKIREDGTLVYASSIGANNVYLEMAEKIILEVNTFHDERLEGMHDVYSVNAPYGERQPITLMSADDRCGSLYQTIDLSKVVAVVETNVPDRNSPFKTPDAMHKAIANHIIDFLSDEVKAGRLPKHLTPLQSGVGNIANAVLVGLNEGPFENMTSYTEVVQDGMLDMFDSGKLRAASATAFSVSPDGQKRFNDNIDRYRKQLILRPQEISNNPGIIRRLGVISMNGFVESDIYGHINSTHIVGKGIENGIGGSGDFTRNASISIFMAPSTAKGGKISSIVPFPIHIDHTEHDVSCVVTEIGLADLRGKSPKQRATVLIEKCAHPDYRPLLRDYYKRAYDANQGRQSPHLLDEAFGFHIRYLKTGDMRK
jgi:succinyl-CoA:acetate CoA-transferase